MRSAIVGLFVARCGAGNSSLPHPHGPLRSLISTQPLALILASDEFRKLTEGGTVTRQFIGENAGGGLAVDDIAASPAVVYNSGRVSV